MSERGAEEGAQGRVAVVAAVVERRGRYLLARRPAHKRHGGLWEFPGGKVLDGESRLEAARRELAEELGLRVTGAGRLLAEVRDAGSPFVIEFLEVAAEGEPVAHEHAELGWFSPAELAGLALAPADEAFAARLGA
ncbi:MAG TPA: NUDIX domain-containing protein [Longimicrobiales bacterium]|nr:NUDIX domain-containing protein [Longimicrobiales bacterium]